jgi:hypothetical protein
MARKPGSETPRRPAPSFPQHLWPAFRDESHEAHLARNERRANLNGPQRRKAETRWPALDGAQLYLWPAPLLGNLSRGPFLHETPHHPHFFSPTRPALFLASTLPWPANLCGWNPQRPAITGARLSFGPHSHSANAFLARKPNPTSPHSSHPAMPDDPVAPEESMFDPAT